MLVIMNVRSKIPLQIVIDDIIALIIFGISSSSIVFFNTVSIVTFNVKVMNPNRIFLRSIQSHITTPLRS